MLTFIHQLLPIELVQTMRQQMAQAQWIDGKSTAGEQSGAVKANQQLDPNSTLGQQLGEHILAKLGWNNLFLSAALPKTILPPLFNRYESGQSFGSHVDNAIRVIQGTRDVLRTDLSMTVFLTEPHEYEGGELVIETEFGDTRIKMNAGDAILYPASSLHHVTPVTHGARICAFFWIQSLVPSHEQRKHLFELDSTIQQLGQELGLQHPSILKLTQLYHNLMRNWVEV